MMNDDVHIGYCTNVHAGTSFRQIVENLEKYSVPVKQAVSPNAPIGIGLWFSSDAVAEMTDTGTVTEFKNWLSEQGLNPFTFNAFPFSDFHQPVVKHKVYEPTWAEETRLEYTLAIARLQAALLSENQFGTISTLPLGWPTKMSDSFLEKAAANLLECANGLKELHDETGQRIFLSIEPEPGCILDTNDDLIAFFEEWLLAKCDGNEEVVRDYLGVCHDVCHSAVMFEPQDEALQNYRSAGIHVGKFQISSAIEVNFESQDIQGRQMLISELSSFAEDRYLHQTVVKTEDGACQFFEDLPLAIERFQADPQGTWRIHFHVPIFADQVSNLSTTRNDIEDCLQSFVSNKLPVHYEVETYAWTVLPDSHQPESLEMGISKELEYFLSMVS